MKRIFLFIIGALLVSCACAQLNMDSIKEVIKKDSIKVAHTEFQVKETVDEVSKYTGPFKPLIDILNSEPLHLIALGVFGFFHRRRKLKEIENKFNIKL